MTCGLLLNELVSNALKHAFPDDRRGEVVVTLRSLPEGAGLRLTVADGGVRLPADWPRRRDHSLGPLLVSDLTRQLQGQLQVDGPPGTRFTVTFAPLGTEADKAVSS